MKWDTISISSDEDVPLNTLGSPHTKQETSDTSASLQPDSIQQCEFCDEVFLNKYTALIHNASHIIIPLLKQNVYQCMECLFYFTSQTDLQHHKEIKHKEIIEYKELDTNTKPVPLHMTISDIVKKELDVKLEDYLIKHNLKSPIIVNEHVKEEYVETEGSRDDAVVNFPNDFSENFKISNRLQFEGDCSDESELKVFDGRDNGLLNDLTTVCKVNINLFDKPWVDVEKDTKVVDNPDSNIVDTVKGNIKPSVSEYTPSIHFEELIKPGMYCCRRCSERYPTKFQLIQHDMTHVKIRKSRPLLCIYCERFISNTRSVLKKHLNEQHGNECTPRPNQFPNCKICGLKYYNYMKHTHNYHVGVKGRPKVEKEPPKPRDERPVTFCPWCNRAFYCEDEKQSHIDTKHLVEKKCERCGIVSTAIEIQEHRKICVKPVVPDNLDSEMLSYSAMLKLCEMCCLFLKNRNNMQYSIVKTVSEMGSRMDCERCGKKFFELKFVKRTMIKRKDKCEKEKKKHLSNSARLKNIQQRLKMINKLSRC